MMRVYYLAGITFAALAFPAALAAKDKPPTPQQYQDLVQCRGIADAAERLACFDATVSALDTATQSGEVVMTDRAARRSARKGLFGFEFPSLGLFGGDENDEADEDKTMDGTIASAGQVGYGNWRIALTDGSVWLQTDDRPPPRDPVAGNPVHIYRGPLGGYLMKIDGRRAVKVRRVK